MRSKIFILISLTTIMLSINAAEQRISAQSKQQDLNLSVVVPSSPKIDQLGSPASGSTIPLVQAPEQPHLAQIAATRALLRQEPQQRLQGRGGQLPPKKCICCGLCLCCSATLVWILSICLNIKLKA